VTEVLAAATGTPHPWVAEATDRIRFGVFCGPAPTFAASVEWAQEVEALGFDSHWLRDHPARAPEDGWTLLAAIAGATTRLRLGLMVSCVYYRHPLLLARVAADVDRLSGGRTVLGLGAGWDAAEFAAMGLSLPAPRDRLQGLEEAVRIVYGLWGPEPFTLQGSQFRVAGATVRPGPVQAPRVPLLLGGGGERVTLRLVARYADASNLGGGSARDTAELAHKHAILRRHCDAVGRPGDAVLRTVWTAAVLGPDAATAARKLAAAPAAARGFPNGVFGTPAQAIAHFRELAAAGAQYFIVIVDDAETARLVAEQVAPEVAGAA
jgi:alkanesulfonate monooxygenase SsuD/methylene tetrahydromethanopterin reductase-like flavin-dependent oxidoreductase (luciferase family)